MGHQLVTTTAHGLATQFNILYKCLSGELKMKKEYVVSNKEFYLVGVTLYPSR